MNDKTKKSDGKAFSRKETKPFRSSPQRPFGFGLKKISDNTDNNSASAFDKEATPKNDWKKASLPIFNTSDDIADESDNNNETPLFQLGKRQSLEVIRQAPQGIYLDGGNEEILLPNKYIPEGTNIGARVEVFIYHDNEGRLIATTLSPTIEVGEVGYLPVSMVTEHGAFVSWGIHRDLFVPFSEQRLPMREGYSYPVIAYIDQVSGRITGSSKLNKHIAQIRPSYRPTTEISILVVERTDKGYRVVVDNQHWGMVYLTEESEELTIGTKCKGYVIRTREDDKIDVSLSPLGIERMERDSRFLLELLRGNRGALPIGDKSSPEKIHSYTGFSKKQFKRAIGALYKARMITLKEEQIILIASSDEK